jgi:hypothetical protein
LAAAGRLFTSEIRASLYFRYGQKPVLTGLKRDFRNTPESRQLHRTDAVVAQALGVASEAVV